MRFKFDIVDLDTEVLNARGAEGWRAVTVVNGRVLIEQAFDMTPAASSKRVAK